MVITLHIELKKAILLPFIPNALRPWLTFVTIIDRLGGLSKVRCGLAAGESCLLICELFHSSSSVWQVERSPGRWKTLNLEWSTWLEDAWRNNAGEVVLEDKEVSQEFDLSVNVLGFLWEPRWPNG